MSFFDGAVGVSEFAEDMDVVDTNVRSRELNLTGECGGVPCSGKTTKVEPSLTVATGRVIDAPFVVNGACDLFIPLCDESQISSDIRRARQKIMEDIVKAMFCDVFSFDDHKRWVQAHPETVKWASGSIDSKIAKDLFKFKGQRASNGDLIDVNTKSRHERTKLEKMLGYADDYGATGQERARMKHGDYQRIEMVRPQTLGAPCAKCGCLITRDDAPKAQATTAGIVHQYCR